jgi:hypothetical protein
LLAIRAIFLGWVIYSGVSASQDGFPPGSGRVPMEACRIAGEFYGDRSSHRREL